MSRSKKAFFPKKIIAFINFFCDITQRETALT